LNLARLHCDDLTRIATAMQAWGMVMAGLYDGLEEVAFKPSAFGGYVFQTNHPCLIGPKRRYSVNDAQKAEIAACLRETFRRIKPFVFVMMIVIPLGIFGGTLWLAFHTGTLDVVVTDAAGTHTVTQWITPMGSRGTVSAPGSASVLFEVSGPPGQGATISFKPLIPGKDWKPTVQVFSSGGARLQLADASGQIVSRIIFLGHYPTQLAGMAYTMLLMVGLFVPYFAALHLYSRARLRPLIAGLPPTDEKFTARDIRRHFSGKASRKLVVLMLVGSAMAFFANAINLIAPLLEHRSPPALGLCLVGMGVSALGCAWQTYLLILNIRMQRAAT